MAHPRRLILAILLIAAVMRLTWVVAIPTRPVSDFKDYHQLAVGLVEGKGYVKADGTPTAYRPPGYAFWLAGIYRLLGPHDLYARLANVLLGVLTCWLTYALGRLIFDERVGLLSALIMALFPSLIAWTNILATENLFIPILLGVLLSFILAVKRTGTGWGWLVLCGILTGSLALIRPAALILPGLLFLAYLFQTGARFFSRPWWAAAWQAALLSGLVALVMLATILPWSMRNLRALGQFVLIATEGGITLLAGQNELALSAEYSVDAPVFTQLLSQHLDEVSLDQRAFQLALQFIRQHPSLELKLVLHKLVNFYKDDVSAFTYTAQSAIQPPPAGLMVALKGVAEMYYLLVLLLAMASFFLPRFPGQRWLILNVILILAWTAIHLVYYGKDRFRLPLAPAFAQFAALAVLAGWEKWSRRGKTVAHVHLL